MFVLTFAFTAMCAALKNAGAHQISEAGERGINLQYISHHFIHFSPYTQTNTQQNEVME